jgi:hypothetical protein
MPAHNSPANKAVTSRRAEDLFERLQARPPLTRRAPRNSRGEWRWEEALEARFTDPPAAWPRPPDPGAAIVGQSTLEREKESWSAAASILTSPLPPAT